MSDRFAESIASLERGLGIAALRNKVIAHNLANVDTPGFQASRVPFEQVLDAETEKRQRSFSPNRTNALHYTWEPVEKTTSKPLIVQDDTSMRMDENNVDIEFEMNELAKNTLYYNTLSTKISKQLGRLRLAISEGK